MKIDKNVFSVEYSRGSGPGGQHKNKVETCCTITHIESGITEMCQDTRSKLKNTEIAYERITKKIESIIRDKVHEERIDRKNKMMEEAGVVRTYNEQRNSVKDHRSGQTENMKDFLNGKVDLISFSTIKK